MKRKFVLLMILVTSCILSGCKSESKIAEDNLMLIPSGYPVLANFNWKEINSNKWMGEVVKIEKLKNVLFSFRINNNFVDKITYFSDLKGKDVGIIVHGKFDELKKQLNQSHSKIRINKHDAFFVPDKALGVIFIENGKLIIGNEPVLNNMIDCICDKKNSYDSDSRKFVKKILFSNKSISMLILFTDDMKDMGNMSVSLISLLFDFSSLQPLSKLISKVSMPKAIGLNLSPKGFSILSELYVQMENEKAAGIISGSFNFLKNITSIVPKEKMSSRDLKHYDSLQKMKIRRNKDILEVSMEIPINKSN